MNKKISNVKYELYEIHDYFNYYREKNSVIPGCTIANSSQHADDPILIESYDSYKEALWEFSAFCATLEIESDDFARLKYLCLTEYSLEEVCYDEHGEISRDEKAITNFRFSVYEKASERFLDSFETIGEAEYFINKHENDEVKLYWELEPIPSPIVLAFFDSFESMDSDIR